MFLIAPTYRATKWQEWEVVRMGVHQMPRQNRSGCKSGHDVPGTYAQDPYRYVSGISCSRCGFSYYNRLHRDRRFLFDLCDCPLPTSIVCAEVRSKTKVRASALHMVSWSHGRIKGTLASKPELKAQSGSIEDWKAYVLWEKEGKKLQFRPIPVLYACAIECATSERCAVIWTEDETRLAGAEAAFRISGDYLSFQVGEVR